MRPSSARRGYDRTWRRLRRMVLSGAPLCAMCRQNGFEVPATQVDHIVPLRAGGDNSLENLQALCIAHHSQKTGKAQFTTKGTKGTKDGNGGEREND